MSDLSRLWDKYRAAEKRAQAMCGRPYATSEDIREAWAEANKIWAKIEARKRKPRRKK